MLYHIKIESFTVDPGMKRPTQQCVLGNAVNTPTNQVPQAPAAGGVRPQPSHHIEVPQT